DPVAVVGGHAVAPFRLAAEAADDAGDMAARHGDDLHGQGKTPQHVDLLGRVDDAHEPVRGRGHDFFAGQGRAAALDQAAVRVALVGTVDVQRQRSGGIEVVHRDVVLPEQGGGGLGAGDGTLDAVADTGQRLDEIGHGGAGADADDGAVLDELHGGFGGETLGFVL